ncbi:MAG: tRNA uridine-5-carboxymethylaminomethyl(34) synthesis GTPase MnmE [Ignavibacteria bacterium RIFOXYB2_FULL_35_12]|nr:MAG: tRNA uridine-5-carboxymethylaminomethyl(34) synthesis GTPase MnmE [Ignavibacteria bacterium GWA2_36_19]OGU54792.1 MAG: tRNA uridine-5-carboxymethylaminomethyl(34) synthesis GTPase MnmE [Ignavibacteria bacterium GWC2_35_8]OGU57296.1 MAG: tRNA uridine-5-carboxymethylaminomethyl(34) synthesis GTPase MnmE [Ignavibacteria bacterium GWF2_35_20]OGU81433.1 MAG: tRNA uridine-5-carboxymethylaminomethyl(34) synthesis GTPase MnmE [Ignavibacteria bacterium RIFOXYA2_FULL_35_9]OGU86959.1 MAG: tRNA uri
MIHLEDTITAMATPNGVGAISIIRISGNKAIDVADSIFKGKMHITDANTHTVHYGKVVDAQNNFIDDVLLTIFKAPNSYTGEDVIEVSCHGNPLIGQKIIDLLLEKDVRIAEPGEFTMRAFLNNRIDLAQAEAVIDIITSRSDASLRGARNQLDGLLSNSVSILRNSLLDTLSFLELELDFSEEDVEFVAKDELLKKITLIIKKIDELLNSYRFGRVIRDGVNVAIIGKPNVGKSSLLNYLLKESRAIVSSTPGTTRDVIREEISIDGVLFKLFDTAGIRLSEDIIEKEGVRRSNEAIVNSDLVLFVNDVEQGYSEDLYDELRQLTKEDRIITVMNKIDLSSKSDLGDGIKISAKTGEGIDNLIDQMKQSTLGSANYSEKSAIVSNIRHFQCLCSARNSLSDAIVSVNQKYSGEFIAVDLRNAADFLGEIIGEVTSEDVLNNIFSKFCVGK